jgi:hypothetical protein
MQSCLALVLDLDIALSSVEQVYETIIDQARRRLTGAGAATELSAVHHITAGAVAGACATLVASPPSFGLLEQVPHRS